ncbi:MAG: carbohydrate ABC transporter permease [Ectothiorhodospiraceae bacterium]|nr:carbohydrate ABC transporter permease [Ectothiorhodospiraceae bacterium]
MSATTSRSTHRRRGRPVWQRRPWLTFTVTALVVVVMFPFFWLVQMSLRPSSDAMGYGLLFTPTLEHYLALWTDDTEFPKSFVNSVYASVLATALSLVLGVPAAYSLSRFQFRGGRHIALWILATRMAPPIAFTIPFFLAYRYLGLVDTVLGLALIYVTFNLALVIWLMTNFFGGVSREIEESAYIDGATVWGAFFRITLPLTAPGLAATTVLCFLFCWNDFFFALILTKTEAMTAPVAIVNFMQYFGWEWGKITAGGVLVMLPVIFFSIFVRRYLVSGMLAGGVKE